MDEGQVERAGAADDSGSVVAGRNCSRKGMGAEGGGENGGIDVDGAGVGVDVQGCGFGTCG